MTNNDEWLVAESVDGEWLIRREYNDGQNIEGRMRTTGGNNATSGRAGCRPARAFRAASSRPRPLEHAGEAATTPDRATGRRHPRRVLATPPGTATAATGRRCLQRSAADSRLAPPPRPHLRGPK